MIYYKGLVPSLPKAPEGWLIFAVAPGEGGRTVSALCSGAARHRVRPLQAWPHQTSTEAEPSQPPALSRSQFQARPGRGVWGHLFYFGGILGWTQGVGKLCVHKSEGCLQATGRGLRLRVHGMSGPALNPVHLWPSLLAVWCGGPPRIGPTA